MSNTPLEQNGIDLAEVLAKANALPNAPSGKKQINNNGTHDVTQYAEAEVNVPIPEGYIVPTGSKTITSNGTHDVKAVESAIVDVPIPEGYVIPSGSVNINTNGTHDVGGKKSAIVNVPTPPPTLQSKSATPSLSPQTLSADGGYDGLSSVSISAITKELLASLDADFVAENIKKDVDLFGLIGALEGGGGGGDILGHKFVAGSFTLAADTTSNYTIMSEADLFDALKDDFPGATSLTSNVYRTNGSGNGSLYYYLGGICWMDIDSTDTYVNSSHPKMVMATFLPPYKIRNSSNAMLYSDNWGSAMGRSQGMLNLDYNGAVMNFTSSYMGYAGAKYNYLFYVNNHGAVQ